MTQAHSDTLAAAFAQAALEQLRNFIIATRQADQVPADTSSHLAELTALVAALPQALTQLSDTLVRALANQRLTLDSMTEETDVATAVREARLHLAAAGGLLVDVWEHLDAAHNTTAHLISGGVHRDRDPRS